MIIQFYATNKKTGEVFCHKGRYCFSEKGLIQSIRNDCGIWHHTYRSDYSSTSKLVEDPMPDWEVRQVELK